MFCFIRYFLLSITLLGFFASVNGLKQCVTPTLMAADKVNMQIIISNYCPSDFDEFRGQLIGLKTSFEQIYPWDINLILDVPKGNKFVTNQWKKCASFKDVQFPSSEGTVDPSLPLITLNIFNHPTHSSYTSHQGRLVQDSILSASAGCAGAFFIAFGEESQKFAKSIIPAIPCFRLPSTGFAQLCNKDILDIIYSFSCGTKYLGAVPIQWFNAENEFHCSCECPVGMEYSLVQAPDKYVCKPKKKPTPIDFDCDWLNKCHSVSVNPETHPNYATCHLNQIASQMSSSGVVNPFDAYVGWKVNSVGPKIKVVLRNSDITSNFPAQSKEYDWITFQKDPAAAINRLTFPKVGVYELTITVSDYSNKRECKSLIKVNDDFRPFSAKLSGCPAPYSQKNAWPVYIRHGVSLGEREVDRFNKFVGGRRNDVCGIDVKENCEKPTVSEIQFIGADDYVSAIYDTSKDAWDMMEPDHEHLIKIKEDKVLLAEIPGEPSRKCIKKHHQFAEMVDGYTCGIDTVKRTCQPGAECDMEFCIKANPENFFVGNVSLKKTSKDMSKTIIDVLQSKGSNHNYNPLTQIHVFSRKTSTNPDVPAYTFKMSEHFQNFVDFTLDAKWQKFNAKVPANENYVKFRYKVGNEQTWNEFYPNSDPLEPLITIDEEELTTITFQCWSTIGQVCPTTTYELYVHPDVVLDVCGEFSKLTFRQTNVRPNYDCDRYCNIQDSNFAEVTFDFVSTVGLTTGSPWVFDAMKCNVRYEDRPTTPSTVEIFNIDTDDLSSSKRLLRNYAINLAEYPTQKKTPVLFECELSYVHSVTNVNDKEVCKHTIVLEDCDKPVFDSPYGECAKQCFAPKFELQSDGGPKAPRGPFEACKGNQIYLDSTKDAYSVITNPTLNFNDGTVSPDNACCQEEACGAMKCVSVIDCNGYSNDVSNIGNYDIGRCEMDPSKIKVSFLKTHFNTREIFALSGMLCLVVIFALGFVTKIFVKKDSVEVQQGYQSLL